MSWREKRLACLTAMKTSDPMRLIMRFRRIYGLDELCQLPAGYGFNRMITEILDYEERTRQSEIQDDNSP
jgi:hypothetical protein